MLDSLLQSGLLCGELCDFSARLGRTCAAAWPGTARRSIWTRSSPRAIPQSPAAVSSSVNVTAKQLPSYGGNLDDGGLRTSTYYQKNGYALPGARAATAAAARSSQQHAAGAAVVPPFLAFPPAKLPAPGQILLTGRRAAGRHGIP